LPNKHEKRGDTNIAAVESKVDRKILLQERTNKRLPKRKPISEPKPAENK